MKSGSVGGPESVLKNQVYPQKGVASFIFPKPYCFPMVISQTAPNTVNQSHWPELT